MMRALLVLFIVLFLIGFLAICITPFTGEYATRSYDYKEVKHVLDETLCPYPSKTLVLSKSGIEQQVQFLQKTVDILRRNSVCFFAFGSTLKGAFWNQGYLPWTDRNDLVTFLSELSGLVSLRSRFEQQGMLLIREPEGYRVCSNNWMRYPFVFISILEDVDLDLSIRAQNESPFKVARQENHRYGICTPLDELNQPTWKNKDSLLVMESEKLFPIIEHPFEDFTVPVPQDMASVLNCMPKCLDGAEPSSDFEVVFENSCIRGIRERALRNVYGALR